MSRDLAVRPIGDQPSRKDSGGREMPRGGRSGGSAQRHPATDRDVRDALRRQLDLPRGPDRQRVRIGFRTVPLRGSEVRTLALVGAFRVVDARDLKTDGQGDRWHGDLEHLRRHDLVALTPHVLDGERTALVTLTRSGQSVLERHRGALGQDEPQVFYAGLAKPREASHDAQLARIYVRAAERLLGDGARIRRVVVDYELKRDYQRFLQERNRDLGRAWGRPDRSDGRSRNAHY